MIQTSAALQRLFKLAAFKNMKPTDFRPSVFVQIFAGLGSGATSAQVPQNFQGGAILLGITASAVVPGAAASSGQSTNNRQLFGLTFAFTNGESLVPGGPVLAEALLGGGVDTIFPAKELVLAPNQALSAQAANYTTTAMNVHIAYHCLTYRFAS